MWSLRRADDPAPSRLAYRIERLMLTPRFRFFLRWGLPALLVAALVGGVAFEEERRGRLIGAVREIRAEIEARPEFAVTMMAVDGASEDVDRDIREVAHFDFPVSSFDIDLAALRATVEQLDAVRSARVRIRTGGVLEIDVAERMPVAIWRTREGLSLLDTDGVRVAALPTRLKRPDLPLLAGEGADHAVAEALDVIEASGPLHSKVRGLVRVGERRWDVALSGGQTLMLPEDGPVEAMDRIVALDGAGDVLSRDVLHLDFRNPDRPTARLGPDAIAQRRGKSTTED